MSDQVNQGALLVFLCLLVIYGATSAFCLLRIIRLHKFSPQWRNTKFFYLTVFFQAILRSLCFVILCIDISTINQRSIFLLISIPDSLFIISYLLLAWQMLSVFYYSHDHDQFTMSLIAKFTKQPKHSKIASFIVFFMIVWIGLQSALYAMLVFRSLNQDNISKQIGIVNIVFPSLVLIGMLILQMKYSGVPTKSPVWKSRLSRIACVTAFWSITRVFRGVINIIANYSNKDISQTITGEVQLESAAIWIVVLIVSQIVCIFFVLDYGFMGIFVFSEQESEYSYNLRKPVEEEEKSTSLMGASVGPAMNMISKDPFISESELDTLQIISAQKHKLGVIHKAVFQGTTVCYRKIQFLRTSKYVIQEISEQIQSLMKLSSQKLVPIFGIILQKPTVGIVSAYYKQSLYKALHLDQVKFPKNTLLAIARDLANTFQEIHLQGKQHGHLTSHNVMLTQDNKPMLADLGFGKVKKYAGIMFGYTNKSGWSSPQILKDRRLTPIKISEFDDVYSFGMILWEMFSRQIPFDGYSKDMLFDKVVQEGLRPMIPVHFQKELSDLILSCWNSDPNTRPNMSLISLSIQRLIN